MKETSSFLLEPINQSTEPRHPFKKQLDADTDFPLKSLGEDELPGFAAAMEKEAKSMLIDNKALIPLTQGSSLKPKVMRWHFKRKIVEDDQGGSTKTRKARWIVLGHKDQQAAELSVTAYAPTLSMTTINLCLQAMVAMKQRVRAADFTVHLSTG
eukprot:3593173-Amphidinium_carterae.1